jgi:LysM repeat protein
VDSLKPLFTLIVLGGIGYVVYNQLNSKPSPPPPGVAEGWNATPSVQMPGQPSSGAPAWGGLGGTAANSFAPPAAAIGGGSTSGGTAAALSGSVAPTFAGGGNAPPATAAYGSNSPPTTAPATSADQAAPWGTTDPAAAVGPPATPIVPSDTQVSTPASADDTLKQFQAAWDDGNRLLEQGKLAEGLKLLSQWYDHPRLSATEQQQLTELLDQVAGSVIYSIQPTLEPPHIINANEQLEDIAQQYNVPWQLIAKVNGIDDPASIRPGEQLKVVRGPFDVAISLEKRQLTLMLNGMYAGRFTIGVGRDMPPREGTFTVTEKKVNPTYHGRDRTIEADDPNNPLGERWIGLASDLGIHGIGQLTDISSANQPGSISLGARDIDDVYDILSVGSKVMIGK